jgi:hypothetical protein
VLFVFGCTAGGGVWGGGSAGYQQAVMPGPGGHHNYTPSSSMCHRVSSVDPKVGVSSLIVWQLQSVVQLNLWSGQCAVQNSQCCRDWAMLGSVFDGG